MKKNIFVLIAIIVIFALVSLPVSAGGIKFPKINLVKILGKENTDKIKEAGIKIIVDQIKKPFERKEKVKDATVDTSIQASRTGTMNKVYRSDEFQRITFRSQEEAVTYWNGWYQQQLSRVYDDYRSSCRENPSRRNEFKQIRDDDVKDLKNQVNEELSRYGNNSLLTAPTQM